MHVSLQPYAVAEGCCVWVQAEDGLGFVFAQASLLVRLLFALAFGPEFGTASLGCKLDVSILYAWI